MLDGRASVRIHFRIVGMFDLIGETLRRLRKERGLTLEELGEAAELGRGQLSRIENNKQEATLSTLAKILNTQGVSRGEFFRRYELVESEALAVERQRTGGAVTSEEDWPREVQEVLGKIESFVDATLRQPRPVAQGAVEVGDLLVLFRVVPKSAPAAPGPAAGAGEEKPPPRRGAGRRRKT
jgi:transcriptional regulator with XRE-family HTH domain